MTPAMWLTVAIILLSSALLVSQKISSDIVALLTILALNISGLLTPAEAFSGFSAPATLIIAAVFVLGSGLRRSGLAAWLGQQLIHFVGYRERRLTIALMLMAAALSAFMSNIGVVAIFLPVVMQLSETASVRPGKLLIPLALASSFGGLMTTIGTPYNIIIANALHTGSGLSLSTFAFLPLGVTALLGGVLYLLLAGLRWLPFTGKKAPGKSEQAEQVETGYGLRRLFYRARVRSTSPLNHSDMTSLQIGRQFDVNIVGVLPVGRETMLPAERQLTIQANDILIMEGRPGAVSQMCTLHDLEVMGRTTLGEVIKQMPPEDTLAEMIIPPRSPLNGKTLSRLQFRERYRLNVLAVLRGPISHRTGLGSLLLHLGDALLVTGPRENIRLAVQDGVLSRLSDLGEAPGSQITAKTMPMLVILLGALVLLSSGIMPTVTAMTVTAVVIVLLGVLTPRQMYQAVDWSTVILIAGLLPLGLAMQKSGLSQVIGRNMGNWLAQQGPRMSVLAIFLLTSILTQFIGSTTTAVLASPIAFAVATQTGVHPAPLLITIILGSSSYFLSPYTSQTNLLIAGPGGYRPVDFVKSGLPVYLLLLLIALFLVPYSWPP